MKQIIYTIIFFYQKMLNSPNGILRPITGRPACRYIPSCSEYANIAIDKYGLAKGVIKTLSRIFRCHPLTKGGLDLP